MKNIAPGNYRIIISHPIYVDYFEYISVNTTTTDLGEQYLTTRYKLLEEVLVRQQSAMRYQNDTLQFLADSFKIRPNASIEDLLRALPGITVDREGRIKIQGQRVHQVLIDGEEFFANDPTIVTQNLPAKIVDKIQVFEKKSEMAKISGKDDGNSVKVINVKLKEASKKGYFGKFVAGSNFNKNWNGSLMVNSFKGKRQLSAFAATSNTGRTLLDRSDQSKFGFRLNNNVSRNTSSLNDNFFNVGIPESFGGGLHYADRINGDRLSLNTNLTTGSIGNKGIQTNSTQYFLNDSLLLYNDKYSIDNIRKESNWDSEVVTNIDSTSSITTKVLVGHGKLTANNSLISKVDNAYQLLSESQQTLKSISNYDNLIGNVEWRKKINKAGKSFSGSFRYERQSNRSTGDFGAITNFYGIGNSVLKKDSVYNIRQNKNQDNSISLKLGYISPLFKKAFISYDYIITKRNAVADWKSFDKKNPGLVPVDSLTSEYRFGLTSQTGGFLVRIPKNKLNFTIGQNIASSSYLQKDDLKNELNRYLFLNWLPSASASYSFAKLTSLRLAYNTSTTPPGIRQIQPVIDNTNILATIKGNENLRQEYNNSFSVTFNSIKLIRKRTLYSSVTVNINKNAISFSDYLDNSSGKRIIEPINTPRSSRIFGYINHTVEIRKWKANWTNDLTYLRNEAISLINFSEVKNSNSTYTLTTSMSKNTEKFAFEATTALSLNFVNYTGGTSQDINFWSNRSYFRVDSDLPFDLELSSSCNFDFQQASVYFNRSTNFIQWDAHISKKVFRNNNGLLRLSMNNILDQNNGYSRISTNNYITERLTETLGRYWLLSFILNFNSQPKK